MKLKIWFPAGGGGGAHLKPWIKDLSGLSSKGMRKAISPGLYDRKGLKKKGDRYNLPCQWCLKKNSLDLVVFQGKSSRQHRIKVVCSCLISLILLIISEMKWGFVCLFWFCFVSNFSILARISVVSRLTHDEPFHTVYPVKHCYLHKLKLRDWNEDSDQSIVLKISAVGLAYRF